MTLIGAIGRIMPERSRIADTQAALARLNNDPSRFLLPVDIAYPASCLDGRPFDLPATPPAARSAHHMRTARVAGGTLTTWLIDVLLTGMFLPTRRPGGGAGPREADIDMDPSRLGEEIANWAPSWLSLTCATLRSAGLPVSAHSDDHATPGNSGCGAIDSLSTTLGLLGQRPQGLVDLMVSWGVDPTAVPVGVLRRSGSLALTMPDGDDIAGVISGYADPPMPTMHGSHQEIAVLANSFPGTTIDPSAVAAALADAGAQPEPSAAPAQVFVVDTWSFAAVADFYLDQAARAPRPLVVTRDQVVATAAAFNAATLLTLCAPEMPVTVLRS